MDGEHGPLDRLKKGLGGLKRAQKTEAAVGHYVHLGLTLAVSTLLFFYAGYKLDRWIGTLPIFTLLGTFLGAFGGFMYVYRELTAGERKDKR
jgi:F0F1-type ATP synthase assembly protein I